MTQVWFPRKNLTATARSVGRSLLTEGTALWSDFPYRRWLYRWGPWSGTALAITLLWSTEWRLLLATGLGWGSMRLVYWLLTHGEKFPVQSWRKMLDTPQGQLTLAGSGGGLTALATYLGTMVWSEVDNPWLATGIILQGLGSVVTLTLLLWQRNNNSSPPLLRANGGDFDHCLHYLAHGDRLQKLVALRQLQDWRANQRLTTTEQQELEFYLQTFLEVETEAKLQRAALQILQQRSVPGTPLAIPHRQKERQIID